MSKMDIFSLVRNPCGSIPRKKLEWLDKSLSVIYKKKIKNKFHTTAWETSTILICMSAQTGHVHETWVIIKIHVEVHMLHIARSLICCKQGKIILTRGFVPARMNMDIYCYEVCLN